MPTTPAAFAITRRYIIISSSRCSIAAVLLRSERKARDMPAAMLTRKSMTCAQQARATLVTVKFFDKAPFTRDSEAYHACRHNAERTTNNGVARSHSLKTLPAEPASSLHDDSL